MTRAHRKITLLAAVAMLGTGLAAAAAGPSAHATATDQGRGQVPSPQGIDPGTYNEFTAVSADSATDAWAVGYYGTATSPDSVPLIAQWNGTAWSQVAAPALAGNAELTGVSAVSPTDVWAVGNFTATAAPNDQKTLILHWNGTAWSKATSPSPGSNVNVLSGVSADSATDAWAAGYYLPDGTETATQDTLILHWNGTAWSKVKSPDPGSGTTPAYNIDQLFAVSAGSATSATAVGTYVTGSGIQSNKALILHWNGKTWASETSPQPSAIASRLYGVSTTSQSYDWAVGYYVDSQEGDNTLTMQDLGSSSMMPSPNPSDGPDELYAVSSADYHDSWAVGYQEGTGRMAAAQTLILHSAGDRWSAVASPDPGGNSPNANQLTGVSAVSATDAWAVGWYDGAGNTEDTIILHWNGTAWSAVS